MKISELNLKKATFLLSAPAAAFGWICLFIVINAGAVDIMTVLTFAFAAYCTHLTAKSFSEINSETRKLKKEEQDHREFLEAKEELILKHDSILEIQRKYVSGISVYNIQLMGLQKKIKDSRFQNPSAKTISELSNKDQDTNLERESKLILSAIKKSTTLENDEPTIRENIKIFEQTCKNSLKEINKSISALNSLWENHLIETTFSEQITALTNDHNEAKTTYAQYEKSINNYNELVNKARIDGYTPLVINSELTSALETVFKSIHSPNKIEHNKSEIKRIRGECIDGIKYIDGKSANLQREMNKIQHEKKAPSKPPTSNEEDTSMKPKSAAVAPPPQKRVPREKSTPREISAESHKQKIESSPQKTEKSDIEESGTLVVHLFGDDASRALPLPQTTSISAGSPQQFFPPAHPPQSSKAAKKTAMDSYLQLSAQLTDLKNQDLATPIGQDIYKLSLAYFFMRTFNALLEMHKTEEHNTLKRKLGGLRNRIVKCAFNPQIDINLFTAFCLDIKNDFEPIFLEYKNSNNINAAKLSVFCTKMEKTEFYRALENVSKDYSSNTDQSLKAKCTQALENVICCLEKTNAILKAFADREHELPDHSDRVAAAKALMIEASQIYHDAIKDNPAFSTCLTKDERDHLVNFFADLRKTRNTMAHDAKDFHDIDEKKIMRFYHRIQNKIIPIIKKFKGEFTNSSNNESISLKLNL